VEVEHVVSRAVFKGGGLQFLSQIQHVCTLGISKTLRPETFPGLKISLKCVCGAGELTAGLERGEGKESRGRKEGEGKRERRGGNGKEGKERRGGKGKRGMGREEPPN